MSDGLLNGNKPSFYARHLHLLGIEKQHSLSVKDLADDQANLSAIELPDLHLLSDPVELFSGKRGEARSFYRWVLQFTDSLLVGNSGLIGAAAMVLLVLLPVATMRKSVESGSGRLRIKGSDKVSLYLERHGTVSQFISGSKLSNGDRLRTEILVGGADRQIFQFVSNADHRVLTSLSDVLTDRLALSSGDRGVFPGSIELVGANEGEILNVLICDRSVGSWQVSEFVKEYPVDGGKIAPKGCLLQAFELR